MKHAILVALFTMLFGCGDDGSSLLLRPLTAGGGNVLTSLNLTVDQTLVVQVTLTDRAQKDTVVEVVNPYEEFVAVEPSGDLLFAAGELTKQVTLRALQETTGAGLEIVFNLPESGSTRVLQVRVDPI